MLYRLQPALVFAVVTLVGMLTVAASWYTIAESNRMSFTAIAEVAVQRISDRLDNHALLITATVALFEATREVPDAGQFQIFVDQLRKTEQFDGLQGLGFARYVRTGPQSDARVSAELDTNYGVASAPWPATSENHRTPIILLEPQNERNRLALGFDMYSEPVRRAAILAALAEKRLRASGAVELVQENGKDRQAGFLMYKPFFPTGSEEPEGFVYAPFRIGDLFTSALDRVPVLPVHITAWDGEMEGAENRIFTSLSVPADQRADSYIVLTALEVAGRTWSLKIEPSAAYGDPVDQTRSYMLMVATLLLAGALAASSRSQQRSIEAGEALRMESERALAEREFLLQEMKHRIKNMISRVVAISRQTARASDSLTDFTDSFTARLQAMAASQDLLARTAWQGADLEELLSCELKQLFGDNLDKVALHGPPVRLNEAASQAFGLAFHELATNALKYGSARFETGTLHIAWDIQRNGKATELVLHWLENNAEPLDAQDVDALVRRGGFGTKLLDATMRVELGGSITTSPRESGMEVTISVPYDCVVAAHGE